MACRAVLLFSAIVAAGLCQTVHKTAIRSDIRFRFATTEVTCVMSNDDEKAKELVFDVTLPKEAFIANFSMEIEGQVYPGEVKEKQKARQQYLAARQTGSTGGLVEQSARHSNKFDVSVNIAAGSNVTFSLIYQELLRRRFGAYEYSVYIDPSRDLGEFSVEVYIQERTDIRDVRTPALRKDIINNAVEEAPNSLTQINHPTATSVHVTYLPTSEKLKQQGAGWFVVQYDVETDSSAGQLLVVDGYFVHFFLPPDDLPPLPLDIVFVLDISGSMSGRKIEQLKDAMAIILDDLRPSDRFNILLFDDDVQHWRRGLQEASHSLVSQAQSYIASINSAGSTDLHLALMKGLEALRGSREASRVPMIFFLSDGEATSGVRDSKQIVEEVSARNDGTVNIYSLAFGSGADYSLVRQISARNKGFARKIYEASDASKQVSGLYREISTIVIRDLSVTYHPTSNNDDGRHHDDGGVVRVDNSTVTVCVFPTMFGDSDLVVAGRLDNSEVLLTSPEAAGGLKLNVSGLGATGQVNFVLEEGDLSRLTLGGEDPPFWSVPRDLSRLTERTWAFLSIKQLLEEKTAVQEDEDLVKDLDRRILHLSLQYHFVTPLTSMVVTRPEDDVNKKKSGEASLLDDAEAGAQDMAVSQGLQASQMRRTYSTARRHHSVPQAQHLPGLPGLPPMASQHYAKGQAGSHLMASAVLYPAGSGNGARPAMASVFAVGPRRLAVQRKSGRQRNRKRRLRPDADFLGQHMPTPVMPRYVATMLTTSPRPVTFRYRTATVIPIIPTTTTTTTRPPRRRGGKGRGGRGRNQSKGGKKGKRCTRSKVLLQSVLVEGEQSDVMCFDLKAAREPHNYTLLDDPSANFKVTLELSRRVLRSLHVHDGSLVKRLHTTKDGDVYYDGSALTASSSAVVNSHNSDVIVDVIKKKCRAIVVNIRVRIDSVNPDPSVLKGYQGIAVRGLRSALKDSSRRRRRIQRKVKVSKSCQANNVSADRSHVIRGRQLLRYQA